MNSKCPYCQSVITQLSMTALTGVSTNNGTQWGCAVFSCPHCKIAISAGFDMSLLKKDIIDAIRK